MFLLGTTPHHGAEAAVSNCTLIVFSISLFAVFLAFALGYLTARLKGE